MGMKRKLVLAAVVAVAISIVVGVAFSTPKAPMNNVVTPVVVELFTSEGCSSCPPADQLLISMEKDRRLENADLILLGEHVDYWDGLGWKDRFSSPGFTERQSRFAKTFGLSSIYTPQVVIDGHIELVGNDERGVKRAILKAATAPKPAQVILRWLPNQQLDVSVVNAGDSKILLAVTEDELTTKVRNGENGGRTLHHAAVARELREIGATTNGVFRNSIQTGWNSEWNRMNTRFIVLVQGLDGRILGAATTKP